MIKAYFACSIRGGGDKSNYQAIVEAIYTRDVSWINEADAIIAEVTNPSLGVGYELAYAESLGKPILTLFNREGGKKLSAMVAGNTNFKNVSYSSTDDLASSVQTFLQSVR